MQQQGVPQTVQTLQPIPSGHQLTTPQATVSNPLYPQTQQPYSHPVHSSNFSNTIPNLAPPIQNNSVTSPFQQSNNMQNHVLHTSDLQNNSSQNTSMELDNT